MQWPTVFVARAMLAARAGDHRRPFDRPPLDADVTIRVTR